ncbi:MAG: glycoside hydrolase family 13 protein [Clostridia bacterium]|nr:glycoside hydrolase family 13 protein [Clostridia bacterium]
MIFNPLDKFYKSVIGAVSENQRLIYRVKGEFGSVILRIKKDGEDYVNYKMNNKDGFYELQRKVPIGLYFYHFLLENGSFIGLNDNYVGEITNFPQDFQLTIYSNDYKVPEDMFGGLIYQIFPDRFFRSIEQRQVENGKTYHENWNDLPNILPINGKILNNDFFGGDLKGIEQKLDYIKSLGTTHIYLNPIFKAYSNHRYDTGDYMQIDPLLGTEQDLVDLIKSAKEKGIKIILDGVFNHTGSDSVYFNKNGNYGSLGAYQSKNSPYYAWYNFKDYPDDYECWWGIQTLPSVIETNPDYVEFITGKDGVIEHYTKLGVEGWRLDVVDELPDFFVEKIRSTLRKINPNGVLIGEVWEDATNKIAYDTRKKYFLGNQLDSVMNYPLKKAIINYIKTCNVKDLSYVVKEQIDHYPKQSLDVLMNLLSTHDTFRIISELANVDVANYTKTEMANVVLTDEEYQDAVFKVKIATLLQFTLYGVPSIYYGDEIGMQGYKDPLNRQTFKWEMLDNEICKWFKSLSKLRQEFTLFKNGELQEIFAKDGCYVYKRFDEDSEIMVAINLNEKPIFFEFDGELIDLIDNQVYLNELELQPKSFGVFVSNK